MGLIEAKKRELLERLTSLLAEVQGGEYGNFTVIEREEERVVRKLGLLHRYGGFRSARATDSISSLVRKQMEAGKRIISANGEFYTIEIAALIKEIEKAKKKLDRKQTVTANDKKHTEHHKPQEQAQKWQGYVAPKYEDTVLVAVRVEEDIRDKFHAVMRAKNTTAQEFLSDYIVQEVKKHPDLVKQGEQMDAAGTKKNYRTKLRILKEENARLRAAGHTDKPSRSL